MRPFLIVGAITVSLVAGGFWLKKVYNPPPRPQGHYFRLKVGLTYNGKPIDFDIVVGCGVHYAFNTGTGGSTDEVMGMTALRFAARMPEGHAVVIRTIPGFGHAALQGCNNFEWRHSGALASAHHLARA